MTPPTAEVIHALAVARLPNRQVGMVERVTQGVSTYVYRVHCRDARYYLRVLPEPDASFAPEAKVLDLLCEQGVRVPRVVHYAPYEPSVGRSVLLTTEIAGRALAEVGIGAHTEAVLFDAGRMLATINSLPVDGFGWVARDHARGTALRAQHPTYHAAILEGVDEHLRTLGALVLTPDDVTQLRRLPERFAAWLEPGPATLAHGDFDVTPIFQHGRHCSGIIDFGEIRGADRWYDLGHFHFRDGETLPGPLLPLLLAGYRAVRPLPPDAPQRIAFAAVLIGQRALARLLRRYGATARVAPLVAAGVTALKRDIATLRG